MRPPVDLQVTQCNSLQHFSQAECHVLPCQRVLQGMLLYTLELPLLHACRYLLFLFSSVLLLGLRESRRRAEAGKPHTLTPPLMVGATLVAQHAT